MTKQCPDCGKEILPKSIRCNRCTRRLQVGDAKERFWSKVDKNGPTISYMDSPCWIWTGRCFYFGHGAFDTQGKTIYAHRFSWEIAYNQPIPKGMFICHHCDNPPCINPAHLFLGTSTDNMRDMASKGRTGIKRGQDHRSAKLSPEQVEEIRRRYIPRKVSQRMLAKEYGITQAAIWYVLHHRNWK